MAPAPGGGSRGGDPPGSKPPLWKTRRGIALITVGALLLAATSGSVFGFLLTFDIPEVRHLQDWKPPVVTTIYAADGQILYQFGAEKRIVVPLDQVAPRFIDALVSTEDSRFFTHLGIDPWGIARALITDIIRFKRAQGGSTITQQLARSLFLKPEKTIRRKLQEMVLALQIEKTFTKSEILEFYCNQVYMGHGRYGVEAAANYYFAKPAKDMTLEEAALLAGLVQRPESYSPVRAPDRARSRRNLVFNRMVAEGKLTAEEAEQAREMPVVVEKVADEENIAPYFVEEVRKYLDAKYGEVTLYEEGLEVHTTLDPRMQRAANEALFTGLRALDKRQGFRPIRQNVLKEGGDLATFEVSAWSRPPIAGRLRTGLVTEVNRKTAAVRLGEYTAQIDSGAIDWTRKSAPNQVLKVGDVTPFLVLAIDEEKKELKVRLDQEPVVEGALLAIDPSNGEIKALVGGYDFNRSQFNRAVQARRQAGSAFKPFVYTAALDAGYTLADGIFDEPTVFIDPATGDEYQPNNYYRKYYGWTTLREAMEESRNIVAVKLLNQVGYKRTIEIAGKMGISSPLRPYPSMALGTMEVLLVDLTTAYSIFPNQGVRVEPHTIRYVADREGKIREEAKPRVIEVLRADVAYVMTYLLEGVTESGTGALAAREMNRTVAGKTGTTDDLADAWFVGFSPSLVAGVWVGFDEKRTLGGGETGARAALPIWIEFMKAAHAGKPSERFVKPANVTYVPIDRRSGLRATVDSNCPVTFLEAFVEGTEPGEACSARRHFQLSLPYFLQRYEASDDFELRIEPDALVRLVNEGQGDVELVADGHELLLREAEVDRRIPLYIRRAERKEVLGQLGPDGAPVPDGGPAPEGATGTGGLPGADGAPSHFGVDGRPATIIPIKSD